MGNNARIAKAYEKKIVDSYFGRVIITLIVLVTVGMLATTSRTRSAASHLLRWGSSQVASEKIIKAVTWNIAAINNNPFEYWITNDDESYNQIMKSVSAYIENPGVKDVEVQEVFTEAMFRDLERALHERAAGWGGANETRRLWESDLKSRKIVSQFLRDPVLGKKRLVSMPDRTTNTIQTLGGTTGNGNGNEDGDGRPRAIYRPTVVNCYPHDLTSTAVWWKQWLSFFFEAEFEVSRRGKTQKTKVLDLIQPIKKSKYPAITAEEEAVSRPLQTLCLAIFDAILVHMMNDIASAQWQKIRREICLKLNHQKNHRTVEILATTYGDADIQFLQEVAGNFPAFAASKPIAELFEIFQASNMDAERDQNSFILLKRGQYRDVRDVTEELIASTTELSNSSVKLPVVNGDLIALVAVDARDGTKYLLVSFHGDTNGLATIPVVTAVRNYATARQPDCRLLFGLDANTYTSPESDQLGVSRFAEFFSSQRLNSCYGPSPDPRNFTTFHARTHLQAQLNKAVSLEDKDLKGDKNPKDFILFFRADYRVLRTNKDNTGRRTYIEDTVFPTLAFPSDHGITSTVLEELRSHSS